MSALRVAPYAPERLDEIVAFWNRTFAGRRNFFALDADLFRRRVVEVDTGVEAFEPDGFLAAEEGGGRVVGLVHAGRRSAEVARAVQPGWSGGEQGYIALLAVDPERRRRGIGTTLLEAARSWLSGTCRGRPVLDGQCLAPFYGNSLAPCQPFWGTTEGVSVEWEDGATRAFWKRHGWVERWQAVSLEADLARPGPRPPPGPPPAGQVLTRCQGHVPRLGGFPEEGVPYQAGHFFLTQAYLVEGRTAGTLVAYPMPALAGPKKWAIYELKVAEEHRGQGIGGRLLAALAEDLRGRGIARVEVLTIPDLSPGAKELYQRHGYAEVARWAVY